MDGNMYTDLDDCPCACGKLLSTHEVTEECMEIFYQAIVQSLESPVEVKFTGEQDSGKVRLT